MNDRKIMKAAAKKIAGLLPMAQRTIDKTLDTEPQLYNLTRNQLAAVMRALNTHWHFAVNCVEKKIIDEGYVYNYKTKKINDLYDTDQYSLVKKGA